MCAQEGMDQRLLPAPKTAASAREADAAEDLTAESCPSEMSEMSTAPSQRLSVAALGSIRERSEHGGGLSSSGDGSFSLDEVPYAPDADADVCAACALMCATLAALACAVSCAAAGAAGACCARVGARVQACLCVGPYVP